MTAAIQAVDREKPASGVVARLRRRPEIGLSLLLFVVVVGGWEAAVRGFAIETLVLPAPSAIALDLWNDLQSSRFLFHFWVTLSEILSGFGVGAAIGLVLGGLIGQFSLLEKTLYPYVVAFQTVPKVAVAPIIVMWLGFGTISKVVITATVAFFPVLANTIAGLQAAPADQIEMLTTFTASRWQVFVKVRIPQALPYVLVGLDVALMLAVIGAIVGEFVGSKAGLGYLILQRDFSMDMAGVFSILIVLSLTGVVLHLVIRLLQRRLVFWMRGSRDLSTSA